MAHHASAAEQHRSRTTPPLLHSPDPEPPRLHSRYCSPRSALLALGCGAALLACTGEVLYPEGDDAAAAGAAPQGSPPGDDTAEPRGSGGAGGAATSNAGGSPAEPPSSDTTDCSIVNLQALAILEKNCAKCHGPGTNVASFDTVLDVDKLQASGKLKAGDADGSPLYKLLASNQMPPATATQRPSPEEVGLIYTWIQSCIGDVAPPPGAEPACGKQRIDFPAALSAMVADMSRSELADRRFIRYLTLTHLHNSGACEKDMAIYRAALSKAVNVLSLGAQIVAPQAIDQDETIYRIDLRDYEWDAAGARPDKWETLVAANPYAVEFEEDDAEVLKTFSGTAVPFQAGDWLVNAATRPPLYHAMLDIPATRQELERQLGIDVQVDIDNGDVWRAGFINSGISAQNRVIERHQLPVSSARTFWISYDFAGDGGRENIFADPLDFEADGSEVIFTLPNGLHAYMVADAAGTRLDQAPDKIVVDPRQDDHNVTNGISCMSCHESGMKAKDDELRDYVASSSDFNSSEKSLVADLHPKKAEFAALLSGDSKLFLQAIAALDLPPTTVAEPIIEVFSRFDENVDLKRAAAELNIPPERLLRELGRLNPALTPLGYAGVKRATFRDTFAETVCLLNLGLTSSSACTTGAR